MATARRVGEHRGAAAYTVGQRQGLGVALGEPRYVLAIDAATNVVTLGRREDLYRREFEVESVSFVGGEPPDADEFTAEVRIRHRATPAPGDDHRAIAGPARGTSSLTQPAWAPAPGQAAVFYRRRRGHRRRPHAMPDIGPAPVLAAARRPVPHRVLSADPRLGRAAPPVRRAGGDPRRVCRASSSGRGWATHWRSVTSACLWASILAWLGIVLVVAAGMRRQAAVRAVRDADDAREGQPLLRHRARRGPGAHRARRADRGDRVVRVGARRAPRRPRRREVLTSIDQELPGGAAGAAATSAQLGASRRGAAAAPRASRRAARRGRRQRPVAARNHRGGGGHRARPAGRAGSRRSECGQPARTARGADGWCAASRAAGRRTSREA